MSDLISRESLKQRINLNYNSHQYIGAQSIKDIINTEPSVKDKTVEELEKIRLESVRLTGNNIMAIGTRADGRMDIIEIIDNRIKELKGSD